MANPVWTWEDANLFCGAEPADSAASNHLILTEVKLPGLDMQYVDHRAGGAPVAVEVSTVVARLECTFVLLGVTPQVMTRVFSWMESQNWFNIYGVIRDQVGGGLAQAAAAIRGQLGRADPTNWRRGDVMHMNYSIRGIMHYELQIADLPIYYWDFAENSRIIGTTDQNAQINQYLNLLGTTNPNPQLRGSGPFVAGV